MNILHLSTNDNAGSGTASYNFHKRLKASGHNSYMLLYYKTRVESDLLMFKDSPGYFSNKIRHYKYRIKSIINHFFNSKVMPDNKYHFRTFLTSEIFNVSKILKTIPFKPDIIIAHLITDFLTPKHLWQFSKLAGVPVYWLVLDTEPFTGGCHVSNDCENYFNACGNCPALNSQKLKDLSYINWHRKFKYIQKTDLTPLVFNNMQLNQINKSGLFAGKKIEQIPPAVDSNLFKPIAKYIPRTIFDLPPDKKIILIGSGQLDLERKGINYALGALRKLGRILNEKILVQNVLIIIAGDIQGEFRNFDIPFSQKYLGMLSDERLLAAAYQAADIFLCPSIYDAGPMMTIESLMCGTPVVAFDIGYARDFIINGVNGYKTGLKNTDDFASGIKSLLELDKVKAMEVSENCRRTAMEKFSPEVQMERLTDLFNLAMLTKTLF
jgi:glycosyltransferase involved in cell wall biosynthesis